MAARASHSQAIDFSGLEAAGLDAYLPNPSPLAMLRGSARAYPEREAIRFLSDVNDPTQDQRLSYARLHADVCRAANLFRRLGVGAGETVAILAPHVPTAQIALWGAEAAAIAFPVNPMLSPAHLGELLRAASVKVAIALGPDPELDIWARVLPTLREARVRVVLDTHAPAPAPGSDGRFEALLAAESPEFDELPEPDATAALFHTGGTTGAPKLVRHTQRNQAFVARGAALMFGLEPDDVLVNGFPLFHVAGDFVYGLSALSAGTTLLIPSQLGMRNRAFTGAIWRQAERHGVTCLGCVPTLLSAFTAVPVDADLSKLRAALTGGSPLPPELADAFERHCGVPVRNILGMTECAGVVSIEPCGRPRDPGSAGLPLPFTEVRAFRQTEGGAADLSAPLAPGVAGIVALRGPNVSPGYTDAKRNASVFEAGGWLVSGDLGRVDEQGRVYIIGRAKDVIIRGSHNIDPAQIEEALMRHPDVMVAAAVGQPDAYAGELPVAYVTLRQGAKIDGAGLLEFIAPLLPEPAATPRFVAVLDAMPLTPVGKIFKPQLRQYAIRHGVEAALAAAGVDLEGCRIETTESGVSIHARTEDAIAPIKAALLGMPIQYHVTAD